MSLTGNAFHVVTIVLVVGAVLLPLFLWNRLRGPAAVRNALRVLMVLFAQATAILMVFVTVNNTNGLYETWGDVLGTTRHVHSAEDLGPDGTGGRPVSALPPLRPRFAPSERSDVGPGVLEARLRNGVSGVSGEVFVWLPPQYHSPAGRDRRFPVVQLLPGYPGTAHTWFSKLKAARQLEPLMRSGRVAPFILVSQRTMLLGRDHGYANVPGRVNADTWLTVDVRKAVTDSFRASADPRDWAIAGFSAGGHGAAKLAFTHPDRYSAAVSLSGYNDPAAEPSSLTATDPGLRRRHDVLNILRGAPEPPRVALLATGQGEDGYLPGAALREAARHPTRVELRATGPHRTVVWKNEVPFVFRWLTRNMELTGPDTAARGDGTRRTTAPAGGR
jgi:enterochelin esterase-like enzyme